MHYLIDGHNLIAKMTDIDLGDQYDEIHLVLKLRSWAAASRKRQLTVIFDSGLPGGRARRMSSGQVQVVFAPQGATADALMIERIRKVRNPSEVMLVTADREIIDVARGRGMPYMVSDQFAKELQPRSDESAEHQETSQPVLDEAEVAEWLEIFGPEPEIETRRTPRAKEDVAEIEPKQTQSDATLETPKEGERLLSQEEIDLWLSLFDETDDG